MKTQPDFETGALSAEVNNLILYAETTERQRNNLDFLYRARVEIAALRSTYPGRIVSLRYKQTGFENRPRYDYLLSQWEVKIATEEDSLRHAMSGFLIQVLTSYKKEFGTMPKLSAKQKSDFCDYFVQRYADWVKEH